MKDTPNRASSSLTYPLLGPLLRRISSYAQLCPNLEQDAQLGLPPSHLSFRFLQTTHAIRFGFDVLIVSSGSADWFELNWISKELDPMFGCLERSLK